jgi:hypothetical protein
MVTYDSNNTLSTVVEMAHACPTVPFFPRAESLLVNQTVKTHIDSDEKQTRTISAFILEEGMSQKI